MNVWLAKPWRCRAAALRCHMLVHDFVHSKMSSQFVFLVLGAMSMARWRSILAASHPRDTLMPVQRRWINISFYEWCFFVRHTITVLRVPIAYFLKSKNVRSSSWCELNRRWQHRQSEWLRRSAVNGVRWTTIVALIASFLRSRKLLTFMALQDNRVATWSFEKVKTNRQYSLFLAPVLARGRTLHRSLATFERNWNVVRLWSIIFMFFENEVEKVNFVCNEKRGISVLVVPILCTWRKSQFSVVTFEKRQLRRHSIPWKRRQELPLVAVAEGLCDTRTLVGSWKACVTIILWSF